MHEGDTVARTVSPDTNLTTASVRCGGLPPITVSTVRISPIIDVRVGSPADLSSMLEQPANASDAPTTTAPKSSRTIRSRIGMTANGPEVAGWLDAMLVGTGRIITAI